MSRETGWYSVRELDQDGNVCESNEWVPAKFGSTGKWLVAGWSKFDSTTDIKTQFELSDNKINPMPGGQGFSYVDVTTEGCVGWINLFFGEDRHCIALINNKHLADEIKKVIPLSGKL